MAEINTKTKRAKLAPRREPYWSKVDRGLYLGFRRMESGAETWVARYRVDDAQKYQALGHVADMEHDAASEAARDFKNLCDAGVTRTDIETVADACRDYVAALRKEGRESAATDAAGRFERIVYRDRIGKIALRRLREADVEAWRDRVAAGNLPKLEAKKGRPPVSKPLSPSSMNRMRTVLVAALNRAVEKRYVPAARAIEWQNVKPARGATQRREIYLEPSQRRAFMEAAEGSERDLIECVALTGCRPGDPAACLREDYDARTGTVRFKTKNHDRRVPLSPPAKALFDRLAKSKLAKAPLFTREGGVAWTAKAWSAPVRAAAEAAKLPAGVTLYTLRHCWITDAIVGGMDLLTVAKLAGTSLAMIEKHYGHLVDGAARERLAAIQMM